MTPGAPQVSVLVATRNRHESLARCVESVVSQSHPSWELVVLDDASKEPVQPALAGRVQGARVRWLRSETPSGVAGARNTLIAAAAADLLVFLDDDAWFEDGAALERVAAHFAHDRQLGILAFRITLRGEEEGELQAPFSRRVRQRDPGLEQSVVDASYFVGAGHAIRREVFERCGEYQAGFVYGLEELDLSYAAVREGFHIRYAGDVRVSHAPGRPVLGGTGVRSDELYHQVRNRIRVAYRNLPARYVAPHIAAWLAIYGVQAVKRRAPSAYLRGLADGLRGLRGAERRPLDARAVGYLRRNYGRLWY